MYLALRHPLATPKAGVVLCIELVKPLEPLRCSMYLALLPVVPVLHKCMYRFLTPRMAEVPGKGGGGSEHMVSCLELADLVPREVHIRTELSFSAV